MAEEQPQEKEEQQQGQFVGGKVIIDADSITGSISVSGPRNILITLGILDGARAILYMQMQDAMRASAMKRQPTIVKAGQGDLANLPKLSRPS